MTEPPSQRPVQLRVDVTAGDMGTLIDMGHMPEQPEPPPTEPAPELVPED